ncbi:MAG: DUF3313 domain-containing protein [Elsteraceae bacterium]
MTREIFAALALACALAGCANQKPTQSGFMQDYGALRPSPEDKNLLMAPVNPSELSGFTAVYIEPAVLLLSSDEDPGATQEIARLMNAALATELGATWPVAQAPGPGVLTVRTAITHVTRSKPWFNVAMAVVAPPLFNGGLSAEAEFLDPRTGRRLGALSWADEGQFSPIGYFRQYGHARALTGDFAKTVAKALPRT